MLQRKCPLVFPLMSYDCSVNSVIHGGSWNQHVGCLQTEAAAAAAVSVLSRYQQRSSIGMDTRTGAARVGNLTWLNYLWLHDRSENSVKRTLMEEKRRWASWRTGWDRCVVVGDSSATLKAADRRSSLRTSELTFNPKLFTLISEQQHKFCIVIKNSILTCHEKWHFLVIMKLLLPFILQCRV